MRRVLWLSALSVGLMGFPDCSESEGPEDPPGRPFISDEPVWSVSGEELGLDPAVCPGGTLAVADLDGDGYPELAASAAPCSWNPAASGHLLVFKGGPEYFSKQPLAIPIDWRAANPRNVGRSMAVAAGDVDGDAYADLLVSAASGVQVFKGGPDLAQALASPAFRAPAANTFQGAVLADVNGDALDDIVLTVYPSSHVFASTPSGAAPFTYRGGVVTLGWQLRNAGDTNGDGTDDILAVATPVGDTRLHHGCLAPDPASPCALALSAQPAWMMPGSIPAVVPDLNGDGRPEFLRTEAPPGRAWLHLSEPETGSPAATPVWGALGDPLFPSFGSVLIPLGDVDGDGVATDFGIGAQGKLYAFFPRQGVSAELTPDHAWPRSGNPGTDSIDARFIIAIGAGDLDGDGDSEVVLSSPPYRSPPAPDTRGRISVYAGGRVKPARDNLLPEPVLCAGQPPSESGLPELTLDGDLLARSLYIQQQHFPEGSCELLEGCVAGPGMRKLLRFSVSIPNVGSTTARVPGPTQSPELYQFDTCHGHYHLTNFATYELHDKQAGLVTTGRKQGFEMIDYQPYCMDAAAPVDHYPAQGISPGWADIYAADLPCQWLDITDVPDGMYTLRVGIDSANVVEEEDTVPNSADVTVLIKGDKLKVLP
ncbi:lysyl oxidase family protein [Pyxidicoccus sp. 3LG]